MRHRSSSHVFHNPRNSRKMKPKKSSQPSKPSGSRKPNQVVTEHLSNNSGPIVIYPDGDVQIICNAIVGEENYQDKKRDNWTEASFICNSGTLSSASPVFKNMVAPDSRFSQRWSEDGKLRIIQMDTRPRVMMLALNIVHHKNSKVPTECPKLSLLHDLAILADGYDLSEALRPIVQTWVHDHKVSTVAEGDQDRSWVPDLGTWLLIAWVFKTSSFYKLVTRRIMLECIWEKTNTSCNPLTNNQDEEMDERELWQILLPDDPISMRPTKAVNISNIVPSSVLKALRTKTTAYTDELTQAAHTIIQNYFLRLYSHGVQQRKLPKVDLSSPNLSWHLGSVGAYQTLIASTGLALQLGEDGSSSVDVLGYTSTQQIMNCRTTFMNCTIQRLFDAIDDFQVSLTSCVQYIDSACYPSLPYAPAKEFAEKAKLVKKYMEGLNFDSHID